MNDPRNTSDAALEAACDAALFGDTGDDALDSQALLARAELELLAGELAALSTPEAVPPAVHDALLQNALGAFAALHAPSAAGTGGSAVSTSTAGAPARAAPSSQAVTRQQPGPSGARASSSSPAPAAVKPAPRRGVAFAGYALAAAASVLAVVGWMREPPPVVIDRPVPVVQAPPPPDTPAQARTKLLALDGTVTLAFAATEDKAAVGAGGDVVWHNGVQRGFMRIAGLKQNDVTREQYQLWIFDAERDERYPVDGGVFDVGPDGEVIIPITAKIDVKKPALFAITVEKPGGVVVSQRERIVLAAKAG